MPAFATSRTRQFTITGNLKARFLMQHPPSPPPATSVEERSYGRAEFAWPGLSAGQSLRAGVSVGYTIINQGQPDATHGWACSYRLGTQTRTHLFDSEIPEGTNFDFSADIDFTISGQLKEMKKVDQTGGYPGDIVDFVPETNLEYYEEFDGPVTLTVSGAEPLSVDFGQYQPYIRELHWPGGYSGELRADDNRRAYIMESPWSVSYTTQFNGDASSASVNFIEPLDHAGGERNCASGYWHGIVRTNSDDSSEVKLDNPEITISGTQGAGFEVNATAYLVADPKMEWSLEANVKQWDEAYGGAVIDDLRNEDTIAADGSGLVNRSYTARKFEWSISDDRHPGDWIGGQNADREDLGPGSYRLNADWIAANGEVTGDFRIMMEDDKSFDSFKLQHTSPLTLEQMNPPSGWAVETGEATLSADNGLKAVVTADDTKIGKTVAKRLTHYRYLRVKLKADAELTPVRIWLGERFWDVLIEQPNVNEEKILDLCAAHNAQTFDDIGGIADITHIAFDGLSSGVTYWFTELTVIRQESALATVLPAFQDDFRILTVEVDRKISIAQPYTQTLNDLINNLTNSGVPWGYTVTPIANAHVYYNNDLSAAYLRLANPFDQDAAAELSLRALPLYDRITIYPGIGDPSQAGYSGTFTLKFTKRLHGKLDGLVYIRDLHPANTLTTTVKIRRDAGDLDTQVTDSRRFYRTAHLKGGAIAGVAIIKVDSTDQYDKVLPGVTGGGGGVGYSVVNRKTERLDGRAQYWDKIAVVPISDGLAEAAHADDDWDGESPTSIDGLYGIGSLMAGLYDCGADKIENTYRFLDQQPPDGYVILDIDWPTVPSAVIEGVITDIQSNGGTEADPVVAFQAEFPYAGEAAGSAAPDGSYSVSDMDCWGESSQVSTIHTVYASSDTHSLKARSPVAVQAGEMSSGIDISLAARGSVIATTTESGVGPVVAAQVSVEQTDDLMAGSGEASDEMSGTNEIAGLQTPGQYMVRFAAPNYIILEQTAPIPVGGSADLSATLENMARITGSVKDGNGDPILDTIVVATDSERGLTREATADEAGDFSVNGIPITGDFDVIASAPDYGDSSPITVRVTANQAYAIGTMVLGQG